MGKVMGSGEGMEVGKCYNDKPYGEEGMGFLGKVEEGDGNVKTGLVISEKCVYKCYNDKPYREEGMGV